MKPEIRHPHKDPRQTPGGHELLSDEPIQMPLGMKRPETLAEQVQRLVRGSVSEYADAHGQETFEESEDFDVGDDFDPTTPYETFFDPLLQREVSADEMHRNGEKYKEEFIQRHKDDQNQTDLEDHIENLKKAAAPSGEDKPSTAEQSSIPPE